MLQVQPVIQGGTKVAAWLRAEHVRGVKAEQTARKVEAFRLRRLMQREIRQGDPGGHRFAPLSIIRRTMMAGKRGRLRADRALFSLARSVGYDARNPDGIKVGFIDTIASSTTWRRIAKKQQEGFSFSADSPLYGWGNRSAREVFRWYGSRVDRRLYGGKKGRRRNVFFLRAGTHMLRVPARPIVEPFWAAHRNEARANIRRNFRLKMAGKRI